MLPWIDRVLYDVKLIDPEAHQRLTGKRNERILANLAALVAEERVVVLPRVPLVPGLTATAGNLFGVAALFRSLGLQSYSLLPYNPSGLGKWGQLGRKTPDELLEKPMPLAEEQALRVRFDGWARR